MKIEDIDPNFQARKIGEKPVVYLDVLKGPFSVEGLPWKTDDKREWPLVRLPANLTKGDINEGALWSGRHNTPGATVRFRTDSPFIAIKSKLSCPGDMNHMPRAGSAGFDLYMGPFGHCMHCGTAQPNHGEIDLERLLFTREPSDTGMREWTIDLPLYGGVAAISVGVSPEATIEAPPPHAYGKILFYGSSITQGGCASRPGNMYPSMLCRAVDAEQVNLGFSGCALGEIAMAKTISDLDLSAFVYDYDYNAPSPEHLQKTHEPFFKVVRERHPDLPVVIMSLCNFWRHWGPESTKDREKRREIIYTTYRNAIAAGDRHVYFIDGETLFGNRDRDACTVDGCHPNDLGFYRMYEAILPVLRKALSEAGR